MTSFTTQAVATLFGRETVMVHILLATLKVASSCCRAAKASLSPRDRDIFTRVQCRPTTSRITVTLSRELLVVTTLSFVVRLVEARPARETAIVFYIGTL